MARALKSSVLKLLCINKVQIWLRFGFCFISLKSFYLIATTGSVIVLTRTLNFILNYNFGETVSCRSIGLVNAAPKFILVTLT